MQWRENPLGSTEFCGIRDQNSHHFWNQGSIIWVKIRDQRWKIYLVATLFHCFVRHGSSLLVRRVSPGRKIVVLFWTKYVFSPLIKPRIHKLSGSPAKSGPLDCGTKNNFPSFFVREKGSAHIYKKAIYYFPVSYFFFATSQYCELRLPTVIRRVKFTDFLKRATYPKMQLAEFRFHTNSKVHSLLWLTKYGNFSENSKPTRETRRHPTLRPLFTY